MGHYGGALSHRRRNALGGTHPDIADGEYTRMAGLKRQNRTGINRLAGVFGSGQDKTLRVCRDAFFEPAHVRIRADEQKKVAQRTPMRSTRRGVVVL